MPRTLVLFFCAAACALAQGLSGAVTSAGGAPVENARVTIRSLATGQTLEVRTDATGRYTARNLAAGDYEVSSAGKTARVTVGQGTATADLKLGPQLSLGDLGFGAGEIRGSAAEQARLDRRSHMLRTHQKLGLITAAPLVATLIVAGRAGGEHNGNSSSGRELHATLGGITAAMYLTTASFAIFAPKAPAGTTIRGPIRWHRRLAWVHGAGMILTPILGAMAYRQRERNEKVHGIAQAHAPVAVTTGIAYGLAIASVSIRF